MNDQWNRRRTRRRLVGLLAIAAMAIAGCSGAPAKVATTPPTKQSSDSATLLAAVTSTLSQSFSLNIQQTITGPAFINTEVAGPYDMTHHNARLRLTESRTISDGEILVVDGKTYVKWAASDPQHARVDIDELQFIASPIRQAVDPQVNLGLLAGARDVQQTIPGKFRGTIDFAKGRAAAKASGWLAEFYDAAIAGMKTSASPATFVARTDAEGRIVEFWLKDVYLQCGERICQFNLLSTYKDYGVAVDVAAPTAVRPATSTDNERL
ncbi:hypothetical protein AB0M47_33735 [Hamadaea sp. NPDC051192]|uniref:hypothetical protein n=1 Tax=Hamadaea sp. NPDC051192 TaxID=3154940 RepID=UPI00342AC2C0